MSNDDFTTPALNPQQTTDEARLQYLETVEIPRIQAELFAVWREAGDLKRKLYLAGEVHHVE